jgi:hypothetical protein
MITDLVQIRQLGESKESENLAFRRYLSAHHDRTVRFQELATEISREIDCTTCANCCRHGLVSVTRQEIDAIAAHLEMDPEDVLQRYTTPEPDSQTTRYLLTTKEGCVFLSGNLCMIYDARPKPCREFPHVAPGETSLGARISSLCRWAPLCPIVYNALEEYKRVCGYHPHT